MKIDGIELAKAGKKIEKPDKPIEASGGIDVKDDMRYPTVQSWDGEIPGTEKMQAGNDYIMCAVVHCARKEDVTEENKTRTNVTLQVHNVGFRPYKGKSDTELTPAERRKAMDDEVEKDDYK